MCQHKPSDLSFFLDSRHKHTHGEKRTKDKMSERKERKLSGQFVDKFEKERKRGLKLQMNANQKWA